jgi:hypothetical protein
MIRTVTLNSGFDELITVSDFAFGGVGEVIHPYDITERKRI